MIQIEAIVEDCGAIVPESPMRCPCMCVGFYSEHCPAYSGCTYDSSKGSVVVDCKRESVDDRPPIARWKTANSLSETGWRITSE